MPEPAQTPKNGPNGIPNVRARSRPGRRSDSSLQISPAELLNQVEADMRGATRLLRFSSETEKQFTEVRATQNARHFVWTSLVALFLYDLFLFSDAFMVPDVLSRALIIHLGIVTPLGLIVIYLIHRRRLPAESMVGILLLILANALITAAGSHSPDAVFISFTIPIIVVFSNIVLPLPFRIATAFSIVAASAAAWSVWTQPTMDLGARIFAILMETNIGIFTLLATYRMERGERQAYLLTLRETLRGETLVEQNRELSELSETDGLTGIANRRVFDRNLEQLWKEHQQSRTPLALVLIDIDHFKRLNDTYGHANGDVCLRKTASRLSNLMHAHQSVARYGGEEFAVLLEGEGAFRAAAVAERLRAEIEAMPIQLAGAGNTPHNITISLGCATVIPRTDLTPAELFIAADKALYTAKHAGRNRVHADSLEPTRRTAPEDFETTPVPIFNT